MKRNSYFQKVGMMLDKYAVEIAERDMKIEMLENKLEDIQRPRKGEPRPEWTISKH